MVVERDHPPKAAVYNAAYRAVYYNQVAVKLDQRPVDYSRWLRKQHCTQPPWQQTLQPKSTLAIEHLFSIFQIVEARQTPSISMLATYADYASHNNSQSKNPVSIICVTIASYMSKFEPSSRKVWL